MPKKPIKKTPAIAARRQKLDRETSKILRLKKQIAKNFWDLGASLRRVNDEKLFRASGYKSFMEYLEQEVKISRATAYRFMDLSHNFSRETASIFGKDKLLGAIAYAKATPAQDLPVDVTRYEIEVKSPSGKKIKKSFTAASGKEIKSATAALLREKPKTSPDPSPYLAGYPNSMQPKINVAPFIKKARQNLKEISSQTKLTVKTIKKGNDPLIDVHLANIHFSELTGIFSTLAATPVNASGATKTVAVMEVWAESIQ